jgi:hypothetical protein
LKALTKRKCKKIGIDNRERKKTVKKEQSKKKRTKKMKKTK